MGKPRNFAEALDLYLATLDSPKANQVKTGVIRFLIPALNGSKPKGKRATTKEIESGFKYLESISLKKLWGAMPALEKGFNMLEASPDSRRNYRSKMEGFLAWCDKQGWKTKSQEQSAAFIAKPFCTHSDVIAERQERFGYGNSRTTTVISITNDELNSAPELRKELDRFEKYWALNHKPSSVKGRMRCIRQLLGWRMKNSSIPLEELRLTSLIPYARLRYSIEDVILENPNFSREQALIYEAVETQSALNKCKSNAEEVVEWFNQYQSLYGKHDKSSTLAYMGHSLVSLAKYIYRNETDKKSGMSSYSDVPVITRLRDVCRELGKRQKLESERVPYSEKTVDWEELEILIKALKEKSDSIHYSFWSSSGKCLIRSNRDKRAIARDVQRLIILMLFIIIPPRRAGVIRTLELREVTEWEPVNTLEQGLEKNRKGFVPKDRLSEGEKPMWFLRLRNFKTYDTYGDQNIRIPDYEFDDGTSFYHYIDLWINQYRSLFNPMGNNLFVSAASKAKQGEIISSDSFKKIVNHCTNRHLGIPINPKDFRRMFVTYIYNRNDITEKERRAFAWMMAHNIRTQQKIYDQTTSIQYQSTVSNVCYFPEKRSLDQVS